MKKLIFSSILLLGAIIASCSGNHTETTTDSIEADTVQVDSLDSQCVDSVECDTVVCDTVQ